jgi:hypothetical protein
MAMQRAIDSIRGNPAIGAWLRFRRSVASDGVSQSGTLRHDTFCYDKALKLFA